MVTLALYSLSSVRTVVNGLDHPEGVAVGPDGLVYAGGEAGQVYRFAPDGTGLTKLADTGGFLLGLAIDADSNIYACDRGNAAVMRCRPDGAVAVYAGRPEGLASWVPNYPVFAPDGTLYVSNSGDWLAENGQVYKIPRGGGTPQLFSDAAPSSTNGLALAPDRKSLYVVQSTMPGVVRIPILDGGAAGEPDLIATLPDEVPDGLAFDERGNLYISMYTPDRVYRLSPRGSIEVLVEDLRSTAISSPTNIAFGGRGRRTLFMASLSRWHIAAVDLDVAGAPLHYPRIA